MSLNLPKRSSWLMAALLLGGCCFAVRDEADRTVCNLAAQPLDVTMPAVDENLPKPVKEGAADQQTRFIAPPQLPAAQPEPGTDSIRQAAAQKPTTTEPRKPTTLPNKLGNLNIPPELPGANAPPIRLPPRTAPEKDIDAAINRLFPPLPELGPDSQPRPGPNGQPMTLADLQNLAMSNSPLIRQAAADVEAAKGAAIQAGAYPNPNFGYQSDTVGTAGSAGFQGVFFEQVIKTGGKLKLAQAAATMDLLNSQLALRRAQFDLVTAVRTNYFAVLAAVDNVKVSKALAEFTDRVYRAYVAQGKFVVAAYEPLQLRVLAYQARGVLVQARNRYTAAWKQLAATLGLPAMPPTELAGRADMPIPVFNYQQALERVLSAHTDVLTAQNTQQRNRYNLRLAQITPVPDVSFHVAIEKDFSAPPFATTHTIQMGVPVPLWDRNKGNIIQAQGALLRATEQAHQVRDDLTNRLATAYEQYDDNRILLEYYRTQILPDQVRAYRAILERYQQDPNVAFLDLLNAQQVLVASVTTYVTTLAATWTSVASVADLLQINDLYQFGPGQPVAPIPDLGCQSLPCVHPCNRLPDPALRGADGSWPAPIGEVPKTVPAAAPQTPPQPERPAPRSQRPSHSAGSFATWTTTPPAEPLSPPSPSGSQPIWEPSTYRPPALRTLRGNNQGAPAGN